MVKAGKKNYRYQSSIFFPPILLTRLYSVVECGIELNASVR